MENAVYDLQKPAATARTPNPQAASRGLDKGRNLKLIQDMPKLR